MNRRRFLQAAGLGAAAAAMESNLQGEERDVERPNVLLIHADQHRIGTLGCYGNRDIRTPNIDRLAAAGVRYENSFCPYPVCTPSRYSLVSGQYVHQHRGWSNRTTLAPGIATFPKVLQAAGYRTRAVGKMHFTPTYLDVGYDEMVLAEQDGPGRWDDDYHRYLMERGLVDRNDLEDQRREYRDRAPKVYWDTCGALVSNLPEQHHATTWAADRAVETLRSWTPDAAHLLMVGFIKPHHPFDPPAPWHKTYDPAALALLPGWTQACFDHDLKLSRGYFPNDQLSEESLRLAMAYYYATISQIDYHVGRMVALLKQKSLYDNTLIIYTADHGEFMGFHHLLLKGNHLYDPLAKVPLVVKWPGRAPAGTLSKRLVNNIDLAPTICRACGLSPAPSMRGQDLRDDGPGHDLIFAEAGRSQMMARSRTRKLIQTATNRADLFFDLEKDPLEMNNLYGSPDYRDEIKSLEAALLKWRPPDTTFKGYHDENAPTIKGPNVPPRDLSHRPAIIEYYAKQMAELQG